MDGWADMDRFEGKPSKKHILSFRVSEGELKKLQMIAQESGADISSLLRQSLILLLKNPQG